MPATPSVAAASAAPAAVLLPLLPAWDLEAGQRGSTSAQGRAEEAGQCSNRGWRRSASAWIRGGGGRRRAERRAEEADVCRRQELEEGTDVRASAEGRRSRRVKKMG